MAQITLVNNPIIGITASLGTNVQSAVLYTVPALTAARIMSVTLHASGGTGDLFIFINGRQLESIVLASDGVNQILGDKLLYIAAGDEVKVAHDDGSSRTIDYYISVIEKT